MEEKKLTDEEIAKAILQQIEYNAGIPYINEWQQVKTIKFTDILDFITRLKGSIEGLTAENKVVHNENDELIAKVERLKENLANEKKWGKIQTKQAVKDTAKEIEDKIQELLNTPFDGKTEKQEYQRKGMEEGLKMALEIVRECKGVEVE